MVLARIVAAAVMLSSVVVGCASRDAIDDDAESGEEDLTGATNALGLRLVYDEGSGHVNATLRRKLKAGEALKLAVRRGRLSTDGADVDCMHLPDTTPLPPPEGSRKVVYQGPEIDPVVLANVYEQEWILRSVTPPLLDRLAREGADSIVEACIVKPDLVRAKMKTSIECAWDERDPNAADFLMQRRSCAAFLDAGAPDAQGQQ